MVAYNKINQFTEDLAKKVHNLSADSLNVQLTTGALAPTAASTILSGLTCNTWTNLAGNGTGTHTASPAISSCAQTSGTLKLVLAQLVITCSTGAANPFGTIVLFNDTSSSPVDPLIAWWNYGSDVTMQVGETFTVGFDQTNGVMTIA